MIISPESFSHLSSPLQKLPLPPEFEEKALALYVKRDDLLFFPQAPEFCGNKIRKLKYNLLAARETGKDTLLTFGGAFSNHIAAVAAAGQLFGFKTIGIIRGEYTEPLNPTLLLAGQRGMTLHYLDRQNYRRRNDPGFQSEISDRFGQPYFLPEGGTNDLAVQGAAELPEEVERQLGFTPTHWCLAAGTGGTMAGIVKGLGARSQVIGVAAVKDPGITDTVWSFVSEKEIQSNWRVNYDYTFGGYAKTQPELQAFMEWFEAAYAIQLEPIYTGKAFYAVFDLMKKGYFSAGSRIVMVHTGGARLRQGFGG